VYQGSPFGATVTPNGVLPLTLFPSVTVPADVIRATLPASDCANQPEPSGAAAIPSGPVLASANSVTAPVAGSRKQPYGRSAS
jgi:hypothetical protein